MDSETRDLGKVNLEGAKKNQVDSHDAEPKPSIREVVTDLSTPERIGQILTTHEKDLTNREKTLLFNELREREDRKRKVLRKLASGGGDVARVADVILASSNDVTLNVNEIARLYQENRYENAFNSDRRNAKDLYFFLKERQRPEVAPFENFEAFRKWFELQVETSKTIIAHLEKNLDEEAIIFSATFGSHLPTYLDLMGPGDTLRLQAMQSPKMLLLGSLGKWSGRDFRTYTKRLNPSSTPLVIDLYGDSMSELQDEVRGRTGEVVVANALELPYADESLDQVYTDCLLHSLDSGDSPRPKKEGGKLRALLKEVARVLKKDGRLLMSEANTTKISPKQFVSELSQIAHLYGLRLASAMPQSPHLTCRADTWQKEQNNGAQIDELGFADYSNVIISLSSGYPSAKFIKE